MLKTKSIAIGVFLPVFSFLVFFSGMQPTQASIFDVAVKNIKNFFSKDTTITRAAAANDSAVLRSADTESDSMLEENAFITTESDQFLKADVGPLRMGTEKEVMSGDQIQVYEVKDGDTMGEIAQMFGVTQNTILWANDIKNGKLIPGDVLIILPVSGVKHVVKKGDTVDSLAKKYKADTRDIIAYNNLSSANADLSIDETIIIPDGKIEQAAPAKKATPAATAKKYYTASTVGYYMRPLVGGVRTQGIHGHNAVDIATPVGTPIIAAADGTVIAAKASGWNGGYGTMIIISHANGTQTVYGHLSRLSVSNGETVKKGQQIGSSGNTGQSTGPHLHFEVRGATNPF